MDKLLFKAHQEKNLELMELFLSWPKKVQGSRFFSNAWLGAFQLRLEKGKNLNIAVFYSHNGDFTNVQWKNFFKDLYFTGHGVIARMSS